MVLPFRKESMRLIQDIYYRISALREVIRSIVNIRGSKTMSDAKGTSHLSSYLSYYQSLDNPGYSVLITGPWGVGKTYQVLDLIPEKERCYVSLFGVGTPEDAHAEVFAAYAPNLGKFGRGLEAIQQATDKAGSFWALAGSAGGWINAALRRQIKADRTLIFDDLERSTMSLEEMLGVISMYLDHLGFRVILIADEEKLKEKYDGYLKAKEKIIGHTISVRPMTEVAFDSFIMETDGGSRKLIKDQKESILSAFAASECASLRVLRHIIRDISRLYQALKPEHRANKEALKEITELFVALGVEFRMGRLQAKDLEGRMEVHLRFQLLRDANNTDNANTPAFIKAADKYPTIDLTNQILNDSVLLEIFEHGVFNPETIQGSVEDSPHFTKLEALPAWRRIINFDELDDNTLNEALQIMEKQFKDREIIDSGEMLHVFALKLLMASERISKQDLNAVREECLQYIEDVLQTGKLPPRELEYNWLDRFTDGYDGYSYWVRKEYKEHFDEILKRLIDAREKALERKFPEFVENLFEILNRDGIEFYRMVCHTEGHDSPYALIPVFSSIEPEKFVDAWLAAPRTAWGWVRRALEARLAPHGIIGALQPEKEWAIEVMRILEQKRDALTGFERLRVDRIIPKKLQYLVDEANGTKDVQDGK